MPTLEQCAEQLEQELYKLVHGVMSFAPRSKQTVTIPERKPVEQIKPQPLEPIKPTQVIISSKNLLPDL